ncbi:hypothetical protein ABIE44_002776 [Marmoricola sp. OAE513]|uniref:hypothetical protein n=1 Tax=Marmoricola sp. OAE513 TaxID=2817894 RepID=UPI001AE3D27B
MEYDEEASNELHFDVVHEVDDGPTPVARWVEAMRRLNSIDDPLARRILVLHRDCGTGNGECDSGEDDGVPMGARFDWGCETTRLVADHFQVAFPETRLQGQAT